MLSYFTDLLREYPALALFLTVGVGFFVGRLKIKGFSLGSVTSVLLVGVLVGQLNIPMSSQLKTVFFMMFLFSIGYSVGPKFFQSLRGMGLRQVLFAVLMSLSCFGVTLLLAHLFSYTAGETVGLFSGSQTCSALLGVGGDAINNLPLSEAAKKHETNIMPVCYAVTYIFGTLGTVILLGNFGPKLLGGLEKVKKDTQALEAQMDRNVWESDPAYIHAANGNAYRAYRAESEFFLEPRTVRETEEYLKSRGAHVFVDRVRSRGRMTAANLRYTICRGDVLVLCGNRSGLFGCSKLVGEEVHDRELLNYPVARLPVMLRRKRIENMSIRTLYEKTYMHGVLMGRITRKGKDLPVAYDTHLQRGDRVVIIGQDSNIHKAAAKLGIVDRPTVATDLMFVGLALFIGGFLGAMSIFIGGVPVSFGTSGGALVAGLFFGWLRSRRPSFGQIPDSALWLMNHLGLNVFIAVVGIDAAPSFISGLHDVGWMLLVVGAIGTTLPLLFGLWLGHKVFHFHPALTLGCCAGTRTCTAALGAVQDSLGSTLPAMGYTVTYAVSNILLVIWGMLTVFIVG